MIATGARWLRCGTGLTRLDPIAGFEGSAITPDDILMGLEPGRQVVIFDDDHYHMANALSAHLAARGHMVQLVTPLPVLAGQSGLRPRTRTTPAPNHHLGSIK